MWRPARAELQRLLAVLCQPAQVFPAGTAKRPLKGPLNVPQSPPPAATRHEAGDELESLYYPVWSAVQQC